METFHCGKFPRQTFRKVSGSFPETVRKFSTLTTRYEVRGIQGTRYEVRGTDELRDTSTKDELEETRHEVQSIYIYLLRARDEDMG